MHFAQVLVRRDRNLHGVGNVVVTDESVHLTPRRRSLLQPEAIANPLLYLPLKLAALSPDLSGQLLGKRGVKLTETRSRDG